MDSLIETSTSSTGLNALLSKVVDIKCEPNHEKVAKIEKPKEKKKRLPSIELQSVPKPELKKKASTSSVSFSKAKKADSKSEESASLLRPVKEQSRARDPRADALNRHAELARTKTPEVKKRDYSRTAETDPLKPAARVAHRN